MKKKIINNPQLVDVHILLRNAAENKEVVQLNFNRGFVIGLIKLTGTHGIFSVESNDKHLLYQIKFYANEVLDIVSVNKNLQLIQLSN